MDQNIEEVCLQHIVTKTDIKNSLAVINKQINIMQEQVDNLSRDNKKFNDNLGVVKRKLSDLHHSSHRNKND